MLKRILRILAYPLSHILAMLVVTAGILIVVCSFFTMVAKVIWFYCTQKLKFTRNAK
jgi:hypothetical protein